MRAVRPPKTHLFVCTNRREGSPLGPGCRERGDAVYDALKREVSARGCVVSVWVTRTHCLGVCPDVGATCARYPSASPIVTDVTADDAGALVDEALAAADEPGWSAIEDALARSEALETAKVLDLARRLAPGLTAEDILNPHDFPDLDDPDWHYADGVLTGIKTVASGLRALRGRGRP